MTIFSKNPENDTVNDNDDNGNELITGFEASETSVVPIDEFHGMWCTIDQLNSLQHIVYNNQLGGEIDALEKLSEHINRLNVSELVHENPEHLVPLVKNNVKIIKARLNTLLQQCIAGAEVANLYDIDKPHVSDYSLEEFSNAVNVITKQRINGIRDIVVSTTNDEAGNYIIAFKTDNSDDAKYNTVLQIAGNMLTEVAFDAINSEVISHLGLPSERDKPVMRVLD